VHASQQLGSFSLGVLLGELSLRQDAEAGGKLSEVPRLRLLVSQLGAYASPRRAMDVGASCGGSADKCRRAVAAMEAMLDERLEAGHRPAQGTEPCEWLLEPLTAAGHLDLNVAALLGGTHASEPLLAASVRVPPVPLALSDPVVVRLLALASWLELAAPRSHFDALRPPTPLSAANARAYWRAAVHAVVVQYVRPRTRALPLYLYVRHRMTYSTNFMQAPLLSFLSTARPPLSCMINLFFFQLSTPPPLSSSRAPSFTHTHSRRRRSSSARRTRTVSRSTT
jgi:hypothetical protein